MAIRTHRPVSFADGAAYGEYDYDDATGEILVVRGVNTSDLPMTISVRGSQDSGNQAKNVNYSNTFDANSGTTEFPIPQGQRKQFVLVPDGGSPVDPYPTLAGIVIEASYG